MPPSPNFSILQPSTLHPSTAPSFGEISSRSTPNCSASNLLPRLSPIPTAPAKDESFRPDTLKWTSKKLNKALGSSGGFDRPQSSPSPFVAPEFPRVQPQRSLSTLKSKLRPKSRSKARSTEPASVTATSTQSYVVNGNVNAANHSTPQAMRTNEPVVPCPSERNHYSFLRRSVSNASLRLKRRKERVNSDPFGITPPTTNIPDNVTANPLVDSNSQTSPKMLSRSQVAESSPRPTQFKTSTALKHKHAPILGPVVERTQSLSQLCDASANETSLWSLPSTNNPFATAPARSSSPHLGYSSSAGLAQRQRKLDKLARVMGEGVPVDLVFPAAEGGEKGSLTANVRSQAIQNGTHRRNGISLASISSFSPFSRPSLSLKKKGNGSGKTISQKPSYPVYAQLFPEHSFPASSERSPREQTQQLPSSPHSLSTALETDIIPNDQLLPSAKRFIVNPFSKRVKNRPMTSPSLSYSSPSALVCSESASNRGSMSSVDSPDSILRTSLNSKRFYPHSPAVLTDLPSPETSLLKELPSLSHNGTRASITRSPRIPSPNLSRSASSTPIVGRRAALEQNLLLNQAESQNQELGQESVGKLDRELQSAEYCHDHECCSSSLKGNPSSYMASDSDFQSPSVISEILYSSTTSSTTVDGYEDMDDNRWNADHDDYIERSSCYSSSICSGSAVSVYPSPPFAGTRLQPAFMAPDDHPQASGTADSVGRHGEWTGEWNTNDIQDVIQKLRTLK